MARKGSDKNDLLGSSDKLQGSDGNGERMEAKFSESETESTQTADKQDTIAWEYMKKIIVQSLWL